MYPQFNYIFRLYVDIVCSMSIENIQSRHLTELVDSKNIVSRKSIENIYYNTIKTLNLI
jgi:hypothetical protein